MSEVADQSKHNDHLIMSFVIQAIINICKENHLIIFFIDLNPHVSSFRLIVETKLQLSSDETQCLH